RRLGASLRAAVRGRHHRHGPAVPFGGGLDGAVLGDIVAQALQQPVPQLGAGLLAATEHDRHLDLRSRFEEPGHVPLLGLATGRVDLRSQLLFLDDGLLLVLARLARLLGRLVLVLAVVHDLADRRPGVGGDFDKVEIGFRGDAESVFDAHDSNLLTSRSDQTDFGYANALVDAGLSADGASYVVLWYDRAAQRRNQPVDSRPQQKGPARAGPDADRSRHPPPAPSAEPAPQRR